MGNDLRAAWRAITARPWFSLAIAAALGLGIGLNTMVFTLVYAVMLKPVPVPNGARLVVVAERDAHANRLPVSYPDFLDYQRQATSFERMEASHGVNGVLAEPGIPPQSYSLAQVSSGLFDMVGVQPVRGRGFLPSDEEAGAAPVVILSNAVWQQRYGGAANIVGRVVRVNANPATVIGVMPKGFSFPSDISLWMPLIPDAGLRQRSNRSLEVFGVLKRGTPIRRASTELEAVSRRLAASYATADQGVTASAMTFNAFYNGPQIDTVFLAMLAAVGFVLLIVCANVANLMLSRVLLRRHELAIRVALGASGWRVMRQLLSESVLLSVAGGALGLALAAYGVHWFDLATQHVGKPTWIVFKLDYTVFAYFAVLCIAAGLIAGLAPALRASRTDVNAVLKEGARSGTRRGGRLAGLLVVIQLALTLVLLTGAGLFMRAFLAAQTINPFIPSRHLMTAHIALPEARYSDAAARVRFFDQLLPRLDAIPGVQRAVLTSSLPGTGTFPQHLELQGEPVAQPLQGPSAEILAVSPGFFQAIGLTLQRGRGFNPSDGNPGQEAAIVTRQFAARFWSGRGAVGQRFRVYDDGKYSPWLTIVGVAADMVQEPQASVRDPLFFVPYRQKGWDNMDIMLRAAGPPAGLAPAARAAVQKMDPDLPLTNVDTLAGRIYAGQWYLRVFGGLFTVFALAGLFIAAIGLYAVMAQATINRTREIGVRLALGASPGRMTRLVLGRGLRQLLAGLLLGLAAAIPAARVLSAVPLGITASDPWMFVGVGVVLLAVGLLACYLPARRAAALDPAQALRDS